MGTRILVVDDEDVVRTVISQVLTEDGHAVVEATNGEQALELFRRDPFPLVLTDIYMNKMTGIDLLENIRGMDPECLVVVMTSNAKLETATAALRAGAHDYLTKPFEDISHISAVVGRAVDKIRLQEENRSLVGQLQDMADRDGLTGLYNHRYLRTALATRLDQCKSRSEELSLVFIDIDFFKNYNDTNGHPAGDSVLATLGELLRKHRTERGLAARYGGEEFVMLLPGTGKAQAKEIGEALRVAVAAHPFPGRERQPTGSLTLSLGTSTFPADGADSDTLLERADQALYRAKRLGRDKLCCWDEDVESS